jgi:uncharacterized Ntn-hydrolase superfamily protein
MPASRPAALVAPNSSACWSAVGVTAPTTSSGGAIATQSVSCC